MFKPEKERFEGWGMTSKHALPWSLESPSYIIGGKFLQTDTSLQERVCNDEFVLTQYQKNGTYIRDPRSVFADQKWRHFIVFWSATIATRFTKSQVCNFVEAGVCDGLTIHFAISALEEETSKKNCYKIYLYDAWAGMKAEYLSPSESSSANKYSYLSVEQTKSNLQEYSEHCEFVQGYIPEVFSENPGPRELSWLHIDLNSSISTQHALEQFVPQLLPGGIVLFDDYGSFDDTKKVVDQFFSKNDRILFPLPTGQAIFFKH